MGGVTRAGPPQRSPSKAKLLVNLRLLALVVCWDPRSLTLDCAPGLRRATPRGRWRSWLSWAVSLWLRNDVVGPSTPTRSEYSALRQLQSMSSSPSNQCRSRSRSRPPSETLDVDPLITLNAPFRCHGPTNPLRISQTIATSPELRPSTSPIRFQRTRIEVPASAATSLSFQTVPSSTQVTVPHQRPFTGRTEANLRRSGSIRGEHSRKSHGGHSN
jgi:hypothetical protein